jgi:large subunit ribosomal protein L4
VVRYPAPTAASSSSATPSRVRKRRPDRHGIDHPQDRFRHRCRQHRTRRRRVRHPAQRAADAPGGHGPAGRPPIKAALRSALSDRAAANKIIVIDEWGFDAPKTKTALAALTALGIDGKALVVVNIDDTNTIKSFLNLGQVQLIDRGELNAYDVLCNDYIVFTKATLPGEADVATKPARVTKSGGVRRSTLLSSGDVAPGAEDAPVADLPAKAAAPNADGSAPEGFDVKGNADSGLYHLPGSRFYNQTVAEFWFASAADAEAAGFLLPPSQRDSAEDEK